MKNIFTEHPHSVDETYFEHMKQALCFGYTMLVGGLACMMHGIFPFLFKKTGSNCLFKLTHDFVERMPQVEERVTNLSLLINKKCQQ